jgi:hypothetical protein
MQIRIWGLAPADSRLLNTGGAPFFSDDRVMANPYHWCRSEALYLYLQKPVQTQWQESSNILTARHVQNLPEMNGISLTKYFSLT